MSGEECISQLKKRLQDLTGVPAEGQKLMFKKLLNDSDRIASTLKVRQGGIVVW